MVKVLLVEDSPDEQVSVFEYLKLLGFHMSVADDGVDALEHIAKHGEPDVILLDYRMPRMNGADFMKTYKGTAKIIVFSAYVQLDDLPYPPYALVEKPMVMKDLAGMIRKAAGVKE